MATEKNITMKQFNGADYDTLYPKTIASQIPDVYSKTDIITTETLSQLGLSADKLPNDAFQQIKILIDNVQASADGKAKIQTGSYVGTGTYGADNPCSLTFDFEPKVIWCSDRSYPANVSLTAQSQRELSHNINTWPTTSTGNYGFGLHSIHGSDDLFGYISTDKKTCYWYSSNSASDQYNASSTTYYWTAIG